MKRWLRMCMIISVSAGAGIGFVFLFLHLSGPKEYEIDVQCTEIKCLDGAGDADFLIEESGEPGLGGTVIFSYRLGSDGEYGPWSSGTTDTLVDLEKLRNSEYELSVRASNDEGVLDQATCEFTIDCGLGVGPVIEIAEPQALCDRGLMKLAATWEVSDDVTPTEELESRFEILDQRTGEVVSETHWARQLSSAEAVDLRSTSYLIRVHARDRAGNEHSEEREFPGVECPDSIRPLILDTSAECTWEENCGRCVIRWSVQDRVTAPDDIDITWSVDGTAWHQAERGAFALLECLNPGEHCLLIRAADEAGNVAEKTIDFRVSGEIDRPPTIAWEVREIACDPHGRASVEGWITVEDDRTAPDQLEVVYMLKTEEISEIAESPWEEWRDTEPVVFSSLERGPYSLAVRATDPSGEDAEAEFPVWVDCRNQRLALCGGAVAAGKNLGIEGSLTLVNRERDSRSWRASVVHYPSAISAFPVWSIMGGAVWSSKEALEGTLYGISAGGYLIPSSPNSQGWCALQLGGELGLRGSWGTGYCWEVGGDVFVGVGIGHGRVRWFPRFTIGACLGHSL